MSSIFYVFRAAMLEDKTQANFGKASNPPWIHLQAGRVSALFSELRLQTQTMSPTLKIPESVIKANEKS